MDASKTPPTAIIAVVVELFEKCKSRPLLSFWLNKHAVHVEKFITLIKARKYALEKIKENGRC